MLRRLIVTRPLPPPGPERLAELDAEVTVLVAEPDASPSPEQLRASLAGADALLCLLTERIDRNVLASAPGLLGIASMAVGYDHIDLAAATELGIAVSNTPGVLTETTADLTWAAMLGIARRIAEADRYVRDGRWRSWSPGLLLGADVGTGPDLEPKVLGIVGFGRIGQAVARRAQGFEMVVLAHDPRHRQRVESSGLALWVELEELLRRADFVTLHVPLNTETKGLIGAAALGAMKSSAYLINTTRGPVVDESALVEVLRQGRIAGAALDVFEEEPRLAPGLDQLDNVLLLPHIGSASHATRGRMATAAVENAAAHLTGRPAPDALNPEVYRTQQWRRRVAARGAGGNRGS